MSTVNATIFTYFAIAALLGAACGAAIHTLRYLNRPRSVLGTRPVASKMLYIACGAAAGVSVQGLALQFGWRIPDWDWMLIALIGGCVGLGELVSRYRDEPAKAIFSLPAVFYILINAAASVFALVLGRHFRLWDASNTGDSVAWSQVLSAGLGAMVILRSSVFRVRVGDKQDVDIGPSSFLQAILDAADRAVDRLRAQERAWTVASVMEGVASDKALTVLPAYVSALMQNLGQDDRENFVTSVESIRKEPGSESVKMLTLGLKIMTLAGEQVLRAAVASLAAEIRSTTKNASEAAAEAAAAAHDTTAAVEQATAAAERLEQTTRSTEASSDIKETVAEIREAVNRAGDTAQITLEGTEKTQAAAEHAAVAAQRLGEAAESISKGAVEDFRAA